jgi:hypothetical protein
MEEDPPAQPPPPPPRDLSPGEAEARRLGVLHGMRLGLRLGQRLTVIRADLAKHSDRWWRQGGHYECLARMLRWLGVTKPKKNLLAYIAVRHSVLWALTDRSPSGIEAHVPLYHRLLFVLLSMTSTLLIIMLCCATDLSLEHLHCDYDGGICNNWTRTMWQYLSIVMAVVVDSLTSPLVAGFYIFFHDPRRPNWLRRILAAVYAAVFGASILYVAFEWLRSHGSELGINFKTFLVTWPTARLTEAFRHAFIWGLLTEYAPPPVRRRGASLGEDEEEDSQTSRFSKWTEVLQASEEPPQGSTPPEGNHEDSKQVPLLSEVQKV